MDTSSAATLQPTTTGTQYLTFVLAGEEYGVDILRVQEVRGWEHATPLPSAPSYIKGVINLRGLVVPILDLRDRFALPSVEYGKMTVVIVLRLHSADRDRIVGVVVDAVSDVLDVSADQRKASPDVGNAMPFVQGMATIGEKMVILLDVDHLLDESSGTVLSGLAD